VRNSNPTRSTHPIGGGLAGGLLAGAVVGAVEAVAVWMHAHGTGELPALAWALLAYGAFGAAAGLGAGIVAWVIGIDGFALGFAGVGAMLAFAVGRFRIIRDVFLEQLPPGPLTLAAQVGALLAIVVGAVFLGRALRGRVALARPVTAIAIVGLLAAAWAGGTSLRPAPAEPPLVERPAAPAGAPNVIIFMIDTLRADHLSSYGYKAIKTPKIDALAADGARYANAFAQASWTRPSVATILTGLFPSSHGAVHKADQLPDRVDTLAELLQRGGYRTVGFANNANVSPAFNFQQGFDQYTYLAPDLFFWAGESASKLALYSGLRVLRERFLARRVSVRNYYQPADVVTREVKSWLDAHGREQSPFFLFVHYMDPHDPYFVHPYNGEGYARVANPNPPADVAEKLVRLYDGEIEYLDQHLGALLDDLKARGLYEKTLIVLTADHGEEFQEHGGWWHGTTLYDEQIRVPLLVKPHGGRGAGRAPTELVTSLDIVPTVLAAASLPAPQTLQGHALPLDGPAPARTSVFAEEDLEGNVLQAVRGHEWKLITANAGNPRGLPAEQLFQVAKDPGEKNDRLSAAPAEAEMMRAEMGRSILEARAHAGATQQGGDDAATQERLRALGYVN
jgi:arylsulfatase A-like enzyme